MESKGIFKAHKNAQRSQSENCGLYPLVAPEHKTQNVKDLHITRIIARLKKMKLCSKEKKKETNLSAATAPERGKGQRTVSHLQSMAASRSADWAFFAIYGT